MKLPEKKSEPVKDLKKYITQIYGRWKIGKTSLASQFPNCLFIATEPGTKALSVYGGDHVYTKWSDIKDTCRRLIIEEHKFDWVVVDIIDKAFFRCEQHYLKEFGVKHESDIKWGKCYQLITRDFKNVFDSLTANNIGVVFISHFAEYSEEHNGVDRKIISNSIKKEEIRNYINGLCDFNFFIDSEINGSRYLRTKGTHNIVAGDRTGKLPEKIPIQSPEKGFENLINEFKKIGWSL